MPQKILIIEDDATSMRLLQSRLEQEGYEVCLARDGDIGLEKVNNEKPEIIILDIEMPRMNGYMFLNELSHIPDASAIKVIIVTSHYEMQPIFEHKGVFAYFVKPLDLGKLLEKIKKI